MWRERVGVVLLAITSVVLAAVVEPGASQVAAEPDQPGAVIVGDSVTAGNAAYIGQHLRANGLDDVRLEARSGRRIASSVSGPGYIDSGIERVRALRDHGVAPELWVIELGTNDLHSIRTCRCADPVIAAGELIDSLIDEIGPNAPIAWVTVMNRADFVVTNSFNEALRRRAATNPYMRLIDWGSLSMMRPNWFVDAVHPSMAGARALAQLYVDDITALLADLPGPTPPSPGVQQAVRLGHRP